MIIKFSLFSVDSQGSQSVEALRAKIKPLRNTKKTKKFADVQHIMEDDDELEEAPALITKGYKIY